MLQNTVLAQFFLLLLCSLLSPGTSKEIHIGVQRRGVQSEFLSVPVAAGYIFSLRGNKIGEASGDRTRGFTVSSGSEQRLMEVTKFIPDARLPFPNELQKASWKCEDGSTISITRTGSSLVVEPSAFPGLVLTIH